MCRFNFMIHIIQIFPGDFVLFCGPKIGAPERLIGMQFSAEEIGQIWGWN